MTKILFRKYLTANKGMSELTGFKCINGYLCNGLANEVPNPNGQECPAGSFCVDGEATLCPAGTYRETVGATSVDFCIPCTAGYYCPEGTRRKESTKLTEILINITILNSF